MSHSRKMFPDQLQVADYHIHVCSMTTITAARILNVKIKNYFFKSKKGRNVWSERDTRKGKFVPQETVKFCNIRNVFHFNNFPRFFSCCFRFVALFSSDDAKRLGCT